MHRFSHRTAWPRGTTTLSEHCRRLRASGAPIRDLTCANPSRQGLAYPSALLQEIHAGARLYEPDPLGLATARQAAADYYADHHAAVPANQVWIGAGTSELYAHAMSILCDPGDVWLVPQPGYPLFDYVADLTGVTAAPYNLTWDRTWRVRQADILEAMDRHPRTRAIVVISPHNPTGHVWSAAERAMLVACCAERGIALVVDEVFLDYPLDAAATLPSWAGESQCLTICLSGISKVAAFPQGKLAWAAVSGPPLEVTEFLARAELVSDTFLNTSTVIQAGLARLLAAAPPLQQAIRERCRANLETTRQVFRTSPVSVLDSEAGWTALLRWPQTCDDAEWAERALLQAGVLVNPGYLFGMDAVHHAPFIAVSLLVAPEIFTTGLAALAGLADRSTA